MANKNEQDEQGFCIKKKRKKDKKEHYISRNDKGKM